MEFVSSFMDYQSSPKIQNSAVPELVGKPVDKFPIAGYGATAEILSELKTEELAAISRLAGEVMQDALMTRSLSDRVYQLMLEDLHSQQQRKTNYGGSW